MAKKIAQPILFGILLLLAFSLPDAKADRIGHFDDRPASRSSRIHSVKPHRGQHAAKNLSFPMESYQPAFTVYTDRALFEAALASFAVETFENSPLIGDLRSGAIQTQAFDYFTASTVPNAVKVLGQPGGEGSFNTTAGGSQYLYLDTDTFSAGSQATFALSEPTFAFGFDYTGVNAVLTTFNASVLANSYDLFRNPDNSTALFWGIITTRPFSEVVLNTSVDSGYGIDQVTLGATAVPEPATLLLLGVGLGALAGFRRRLKP